MKISEIRQQYPQYDDLSDMQLADALHEKFYADLPKDKVYDQLGLNAGKEGFLPALESSFENLKGDIAGLAGRSGLVDVEKAAKYQKEREEESKKLFQPTQKGWLEAPLTKLGELAGGSLPYMVAPAVAGALAPEGLAALGATGALSATQFTGSNLSRQVQEGKSLAQTNLGAAAAAAVPQAALDVFSLHMIPGIKGIFGKMGESITDAEAKRIAQQGLGKTIGDYVGQTGKAMGAEGLTEAGQQVFERLQAGLSITDPEARQEYLDNFIGGAALGGVLAPAGRFIERGQIKNQAAQADQAQLRQDQIEALKAQKDAELSQAQNANDPAYWAKFAEDYEAQEQAFKDLQKQVKKPNLKTALPAEIAAYEENKAKLAEMRKDLADKSKEYLRIRPLYNQLQTQKKQAEEGRLQNIETQAAGIDQEAQQYPYHQAPQGTLPGMAEPGIMPEAQKQLNGLKAEQLYKQQQDLQAQRDAHQMRESEILGAGNLDEFKALREKGRMLDAEHEHVTEQLKQLGGFTPEAEEKERPTHEALQSKLNKKLSDLQKLSGEGYDPVKADKILKEINALETQLKEPAPVQQQMGFDFGERDKTPYSEPRNQTALRQQREYLPGQEINEQEQEVLDKAEQERVEGERLALIAPEVAALKRMGGYDKNNVWHAFGTAVTTPNQTAVMSRTAQSLTGQEPKPNLEGYQGEGKTVPTTQDQALLKGYGDQGQLFPTAPEDRAGTPQRAVGASFRLFSERGEVPQDPEEREAYFDWLKQDLMTRTASALAQHGLTNEAHTVLRKAENTLDRLIETDTRDPEFLKTLDEQLKRIEQGGVSERSAEVSGVQSRINGLRDQIKKLGQFEPTDTEKVKRFQSLNNQLNSAEKQLEQVGGRAVEGRARPGVGGPTEKLKTFEPNVEKRVARETDRRVLTAKPNDLALQEDLEKQMARINEALGEGPLKKKDTQGVLFPEEQEKLGVAKETPSQFRRYMESATVRKLRDALNKDKQELDGLASLNELKTRAEQANKEFEELNKRVQAVKDATAVIKNEKDVGKLERDINEIRQIAVKRVVDRMHLQGKLDSLKEEQRKWEKVLNTLPSRQDINTGRTFVNQLNAVEEEYQRAVNEMAELQGALSVLDAYLKVANAKNTLDKYALNPISTGELATKKQALDAANTNLAEVQKQVSALIQKNKADEAAERRRQEAIRRAEAERQNIDVSKEKQRRLEAAYREDYPTEEYALISEAQRAARNITERVPTTDAEEQAIRGNPQKVLGGYIGKVTAIEKRIKLAQDRAKEARMGDLKKYAEALENLTESYKRAKTADARESILPRLEAAEKKYNDEADKLATEPITWIGMAKDFKDLSMALNQQYRLEERIASGEVSTTYERAPKSAIRKGSVSAATSKNTIADLENKLASAKTDAQRESLKRRIEVAQSNLRAANELKKAKEEAKANQIKAAEERLAAPNTSVEPMEKMQRAKLSKPEKTVYGKAGAESREELREKITREVKAKEITENEKYRVALQAKKDSGQALNPFEEVALKRLSPLKNKNGGKLRGTSGPNDTPLSEQNIARLGEGDLGGVLTQIAHSSDNPVARRVAAKIQSIVNTNGVSSRLVDTMTKEEPDAPGMISKDGKRISINENTGLSEESVIHECVHAATMFELDKPEDQLTANQVKAKDMLNKMMAQIKADSEFTNSVIKDGDIHEFVAEGNASRAVQDYMRTHEYDGRSMWQKFKEAVMRLLGMDVPAQGSMLDQFLDASEQFMRVKDTQTIDKSGPLFRKTARYNDAEYAAIGALADKFVAKNKTFYESVKANSSGLAFETQLVDRFAGFERIAKTMDKLKGSQMMYYLRMYDQRMNFVSQSVANGALRIEEKTRADGRKEYLIQSKTGPSLKSTVDILKEATPLVGNGEAVNRLFTLYMSAIRAKDKGFSALHFGNNITEAELNQAKNKIDANEELKDVFNRARDEYNNYNRNQLAFVAQTGALSKDLVARLLKENDYIPWYRQRNGVAELIIGNENPIRVGSIAEQPYLQELVGGDAPILDFLTSSVQNTNMLADMGLRNLATKNAVFELVDMDLAHIGKGRIASPEAVKFKVDGEDRYAVIDTDKVGVPADILVKGMEGIPTQMPFVFRVLGMPAKLIRKTVTASPLYAAKQLFRDSLTAPIMAGANFTPVLGSLKEINSATKATLEQRGITGGQIFTGTSEDLSRVLRDIVNDKPGWMNSLAKWEALSMEADATTRRAQYNSYIQQGLSEMEATLMSLESMNFNKRGASPSIHIMGQLIPFFNAQIQSLNVIYKALTGKLPFNEKLKIQEKLLVRGAMLAGVSLAYAAMMQDDKAYKNATPDQKYNNWFIRVPGVDEPVRLPIPFEIGYLFKALPEALYNSIVNKHGAEEAAAAFGGIIKNLIPGGTSYGIPQALRPAIEAGLGKSFYTGNDILSKREQNLLPEAQFRENTTEISKAFGKAAGVSPIKIDELVKGYTGTMGLAFLQAVSMGIPKGTSPEKAYTRLSDMPVVGGAFQPNDAGGIISNVYDRMDEIKKVKTTVDSYINQGKKAEAVDLLNRTGNDYAASEVANYYTTTMRDLTAFENAVRASNWSPEQKRQKLDQIRDAKIKFATTVREATDKSVPRVSHS